jgi:hypothetical protein
MKSTRTDELRPEYDLTRLKGAVKGKYAQQYAAGTNLVVLEKDIAEVFQDSKAVNDALRSLINIARTKVKRAA